MFCDGSGYIASRYRKMASPIRPSVLLTGERDLNDLLGIRRPISLTDSVNSKPRRHHRELPTLSPKDKQQHSDHPGRSRSPPRSTSSAFKPDDQEPNEDRLTRSKPNAFRRRTAACDQPRPIYVDRTTEVETTTRSRSAPPTSGKRTAMNSVRFAPPERRSMAAVSFVTAEQSTRPEVVQSLIETLDSRTKSSSVRNPTRSRDEQATVSSKKVPGKQKGELKRVASTTMRIKFNPPSVSTSSAGGDSCTDPRPVGYEPEVADLYRAKRRPWLAIGSRSVPTRNALSAVTHLNDKTSLIHMSTSDVIAYRSV